MPHEMDYHDLRRGQVVMTGFGRAKIVQIKGPTWDDDVVVQYGNRKRVAIRALDIGAPKAPSTPLIDERIMKRRREVGYGLSREERRYRNPGRSSLAKDAAIRIRNIVDAIRDQEKRDVAEFGGRYRDPVADVHIITDPKQIKRISGRDSLVLVTYDGAGYDFFSYGSDYVQIRDKVREAVYNSLRPLGLQAQDHDNMSFGIYER